MNTDYELKLRSWYLARLRKSALSEEMASRSTPSTLVGADSQRVKELVQSKAAPDQAETASDAGNNPLTVNWLLALVAAALVGAVYYLLI